MHAPHEDSTASAGEASRGASQEEDGVTQGDLEEQAACHYMLHHVHRDLYLHEQLEPQQQALGEEGGHPLAREEPPQQDCDGKDEHHCDARATEDSTASVGEASHVASQREDGGNQGDLEEQVACRYMLHYVHRDIHPQEQLEPQ